MATEPPDAKPTDAHDRQPLVGVAETEQNKNVGDPPLAHFKHVALRWWANVLGLIKMENLPQNSLFLMNWDGELQRELMDRDTWSTKTAT